MARSTTGALDQRGARDERLVIRARLWQFRFITADGEVEKALATKGFGGMDAGLRERMDRY